MQKKQGNISILVLFVLVAAALMGVLTMNFIKQMLYSSGNMFSYYKSYYMANAGLELLVTQTKYRGIGWEASLLTGNSIIAQNFACEDCDISAHILGTTDHLSASFWKGTGCKDPFVLKNSESLLIPLFRDTSSGTIADSFNDTMHYTNLSQTLLSMEIETANDTSDQSTISLGVLILSGNDLYSDGIFFRPGTLQSQAIIEFAGEFESYADEIEPFDDNRTLRYSYTQNDYPFLNYFIIANTSSDPISFCISSDRALPAQNFLISSNGRWGQQMIGLELISQQAIPSFLLNSYFGELSTPATTTPTLVTK